MTNQPLRLVVTGHVDHGKSTLVGRLLYDTGSLSEVKLDAIKRACDARGMAFEWAFLMDALKAERDQNVTIETSEIWLRGAGRDTVIIDAPGHGEFIKNMVSGAASADAALIVIDAKEGISEQTRRHGFLLHLLGLRQIAVIVNKMDAVSYDEKIFDAIEKDFRGYLKRIGIEPHYFIPVSAREGENITEHSPRMKWCKGPPLADVLAEFETSPPLDGLPLRLFVQDVYKADEKRIIVGRMESGKLRVGDKLLLSPSGSQATVDSIEAWNAPGLREASAGAAVGITFKEPVFVERGQIISHMHVPPQLTNRFRASVFWLGKSPLVQGKRYKIYIGTQEAIAEAHEIVYGVDVESLEQDKKNTVGYGDVAEVIWRTRGQVALDEFSANPHTGRFVILESQMVAGGGTISMKGFSDQRTARPDASKSQYISPIDFGISSEQRASANGHLGGILWFTGLSGSGKSTLAAGLQKRLFAKNYQVVILDGDNIRAGLSRDLGFSPSDRSENIRRVAEVAALFANAGVIVITAFISPYRQDRMQARAIASDRFHDVYINASLETCESRDNKGLYKKARAGKISEFTGISAPYEAPQNPDLTVDTETLDIAACVDLLTRYVEHHFVEPLKEDL